MQVAALGSRLDNLFGPHSTLASAVASLHSPGGPSRRAVGMSLGGLLGLPNQGMVTLPLDPEAAAGGRGLCCLVLFCYCVCHTTPARAIDPRTADLKTSSQQHSVVVADLRCPVG